LSYHYTPLQKVPLQLSCRPRQVLEGCNKVSPESSLLQAEQPQLSQPFLTGEVFQPSDLFCGPPLDLLQQVHVLHVLSALELDARLWVRSQQSGVRDRITTLDLLVTKVDINLYFIYIYILKYIIYVLYTDYIIGL